MKKLYIFFQLDHQMLNNKLWKNYYCLNYWAVGLNLLFYLIKILLPGFSTLNTVLFCSKLKASLVIICIKVYSKHVDFYL